jgi:hypothetical protein
MVFNASILRIDVVTGVTGAGMKQLAPGAAMSARCALYPATAEDKYHGSLEADEKGAIVNVKDTQLIPALQAAGYSLENPDEPKWAQYFLFQPGQQVLIRQDRAGDQLYRVKDAKRGGNGSMAMSELTLLVD